MDQELKVKIQKLEGYTEYNELLKATCGLSLEEIWDYTHRYGSSMARLFTSKRAADRQKLYSLSIRPFGDGR